MAYKYIDNYREQGARKKLVEELRKKELRTKRCLKPLVKLPATFFDETFWNQAYKDIAFPIGEGKLFRSPIPLLIKLNCSTLKKAIRCWKLAPGVAIKLVC
ncbi:hypothetical protein [Mucilaginibacter antarcticus]|uniref:hypothetical protein n=1 Tax=Mucilaginibacter antarcticus TaxID=1855725 RepID=UPI0036353FA8